MASKAEAKQLAAELLRIVPINQTMQSHHSTRMGEAYDEVYAQLQVKGLAIWASSAEMPDEITPHFVMLMAYNKKDLVGTSESQYQRIMIEAGVDGEKSIGNIRNLINPAFVTEEFETDY